jgi:NADH-quinone oxidoreductase subunit C
LQEIQSRVLAKTLEDMKVKGYNYLKKITAVDYIDRLEVIYIIYNPATHRDEILSVKIAPENPEIETIMHLYKSADWYERELSEMFGIKIKGRKTKRLLLEKWDGEEAPLRKSFVWGNPNYKRQK